MIDAQPAGMMHIGADQLDEAAIAFFAQGAWMEGWQTPVLTAGVLDTWRGTRRRSSNSNKLRGDQMV